MRGLGELEAAVMHVLWRAQRPMRVRDVLEQLSVDRKLAYTTVQTVMDHLYAKGWVVRERAGKAYSYQPATSREEAAARAVREVLDASGAPEAALLHFVRSATERESAVLRAALNWRADQP